MYRQTESQKLNFGKDKQINLMDFYKTIFVSKGINYLFNYRFLFFLSHQEFDNLKYNKNSNFCLSLNYSIQKKINQDLLSIISIKKN